MEARGEETHLAYGSHGVPKLPSYPSSISRPPLSALDKFLLGHPDLSQSQLPHKTLDQDHNNEMLMMVTSGFGEFSSPFSSSVPRSHASGSHSSSNPPSSWLLPVLQDQPNCTYLSFDDRFRQGGIFEGGFIDFDQDSNHRQLLINAGLDLNCSKRGKGSSAFLIKGQWTEEEDSALIELVDELGFRKWAQIAEKLLGRTGKQCRERWQNHLRPDIKKDSWTEEEEKLLVRAHQLFGNKWAEIAKKIPGRTENSIKNHWNATKRRQNSKRKSKKIDGKSGKQKSCVLQEYIKKICQSGNPMEDLSDTDGSSPLLDNGCDDEILFMQNFFKEFNASPIVPQVVAYDDQVSLSPSKPDNNQPTQETEKEGLSSCYENPIDLTQEVMDVDPSANARVSGPLSSDLYISQLLEGVGYKFGSSSPLFSISDDYNYSYDEINKDDMETEEHTVCQESKDMDLMEMVYGAALDPFAWRGE